MPRALRLRRALAATAAAAALTATAGCASTPLRLGLSPDRPGLSVQRLHDRTGFEADLARDLGRRLGHVGKTDAPLFNVLERRSAPPAGPMPYDVLVAAYPATEALRARSWLLGPYLQGGQDVAVRTGERDVTSPASLSGRTVCLVAGTAMGRKAATTFPGATITYRSTLSTCLTDLRAKAVDAVSDERLALRGYAATAPFTGSITVLGLDMGRIDYYVAVDKGQAPLCPQVRDALAAAIKDGSWAKAYETNLVRTGIAPSVPAPPRQTGTCG